MTDGKEPSTAPSSDAAPVASPEPAPTSPPVGDATPNSPAPADKPVEAPAKPADAPAPAPAAEAPVVKSVIGEALDKVVEKAPEPAKQDAKPAEEAKKPDAEPKKEEAAQSVEPAPLPTYDPFKLPEDLGITYEEAGLGEFTKELAEFQVKTKADQKEMQAFGQKLIDRHVSELRTTVNRLNDFYMNEFEKQKAEWRDAFEKDPELGGNRRDTTISSALEFIRTHGGTPEQQKEFRTLMDQTGVGNHPAMIRILAQAARAMSEGKPLPAAKPVQTQSKVAKRYGSSQ